MNKKKQTIETYNNNAQLLAKKFDELGARRRDVEKIFVLAQKKNPQVLEIGCGNGRDAKEIVKRTNNYLGIDISEKLIAIALKNIPKGRFKVADIENFIFPKGLDIIFAFASLIHVPKKSLKRILSNAWAALNDGGLIYLSMKYADTYAEITKEDEFGVRTYYLYSKNDLGKLTDGFTIIKSELNNLRGQLWQEMILKKEL